MRESKFYTELTNMAVGCGSGVLSWVVSGASGAAAPVSGGASLIITQVTAVAGYAGWVSCGNSAFRLVNESVAPQINDWLDSQPLYTSLSNALDVIALVGGALATHTAVKSVLMLKRTTHKSMTEISRGWDVRRSRS